MSLEGAVERIAVQPGDALVVIDMQCDFMPGGALPVAGGDEIVPLINRLMEPFAAHDLPVVLTQDWHPHGHHSFAEAHPGMAPYDPFESEGIGPILWPAHCVQGTPGAAFHAGLRTNLAQVIVRKGYHREIDSYSGFLENDHRTETGLDGYLRGRGVRRLFVCGLALDYCVFYTAADGADKGYTVVLVEDASRPVGSPADSVERARAVMARKGVQTAQAHTVGITE